MSDDQPVKPFAEYDERLRDVKQLIGHPVEVFVEGQWVLGFAERLVTINDYSHLRIESSKLRARSVDVWINDVSSTVRAVTTPPDPEQVAP